MKSFIIFHYDVFKNISYVIYGDGQAVSISAHFSKSVPQLLPPTPQKKKK